MFLFYRNLRQCKPFKENAEHSLNRARGRSIFFAGREEKSVIMWKLKRLRGKFLVEFASFLIAHNNTW